MYKANERIRFLEENTMTAEEVLEMKLAHAQKILELTNNEEATRHATETDKAALHKRVSVVLCHCMKRYSCYVHEMERSSGDSRYDSMGYVQGVHNHIPFNYMYQWATCKAFTDSMGTCKAFTITFHSTTCTGGKLKRAQ
jgi:hypothetical protein